MNLQKLEQLRSKAISYRLADKVGTGMLIVEGGKASITASSSDDGIEGVEAIRLTSAQCDAIEEKDGVLTLEA